MSFEDIIKRGEQEIAQLVGTAAREETVIRTDLAGMFRGRQPVPAAQAAPATQEDHMSFGTDLHRVAAVVEHFGEDGLAVMEAVAGNPELRALVIAGARIAGLPLSGGVITVAATTLGAIETAWHDAQSALSQPKQAAADSTPAPAAPVNL